MKRFSYLIPCVIALMASGCETMNSSFSCNLTAGDSCMTIEQVDAMTRFADDSGSDYRARQSKATPRPRSMKQNALNESVEDEPIWIAPWKDKSGREHPAQTLYAGRFNEQKQG